MTVKRQNATPPRKDMQVSQECNAWTLPYGAGQVRATLWPSRGGVV